MEPAQANPGGHGEMLQVGHGLPGIAVGVAAATLTRTLIVLLDAPGESQ